MKPSELFPKGVYIWEGHVGTIAEFNDQGQVTFSSEGNLYMRGIDMDLIAPLPISPAVLRGLGFEFDKYNVFRFDNMILRYSHVELAWHAIMHQRGFASPKYAHTLQALTLHLYGVELVWNQSEYDKAIKEETKP